MARRVLPGIHFSLVELEYYTLRVQFVKAHFGNKHPRRDEIDSADCRELVDCGCAPRIRVVVLCALDGHEREAMASRPLDESFADAVGFL